MFGKRKDVNSNRKELIDNPATWAILCFAAKAFFSALVWNFTAAVFTPCKDWVVKKWRKKHPPKNDVDTNDQ